MAALTISVDRGVGPELDRLPVRGRGRVHWTIRGPEGHVVTYGSHPERGPWCSVDGGARHYASVESFDGDAPVLSVLTCFAQYGLFGADDIYDAVAWLGGGEGLPGWPGRRRRAPRRLRRISGVIRRLMGEGR